MTLPDREDGLTQPPRPGEGIRIIGAEEAASSDTTPIAESRQRGRRPSDAPKFGDVPAVPSGPKPALRFPLDEDGIGETEASAVGGTRVTPSVAGANPPGPAPVPPTSAPFAPGYELPHWAEPATGDVPPILPGPPGSGADDAVRPVGAPSPRWRAQGTDWDERDFGDPGDLADESTRIGALDNSRTEHSDLFSFDDPHAAHQPPKIGRRRGRPPRSNPGGAAAVGRKSTSAGVAIGIGAVIGGLFLGLARLGPNFLFGLAAIVVLLCATELFAALRTAGHRPATLLGLVATVAVTFGAYTKGVQALPLVLVLTVIFSLLWYLAGVLRSRPTVNVAVTLLGFCWAGFLGSYAGLILRPASYVHHRNGVGLLVAAAVCTVATDIGAYAFGRTFGRTPLAPSISPNKTWEGLLGGVVCTVVIGTAIVSQVSPFHVAKAFWLAVVIAVVAPLGDLCESLVKRDIGVKDLGSLLPGHGGVFDRFDSLLFALPATYYLAQVLHYGR